MDDETRNYLILRHAAETERAKQLGDTVAGHAHGKLAHLYAKRLATGVELSLIKGS